MSPTSLQTAFDDLGQGSAEFDADGRTASVAMLIWFLVHVFRMDDVDAQDAVCDASGDHGIDGLATIEADRELVVFQSYRKTKLKGTLGDASLKEFVGARVHLASGAAVQNVIDNTPGTELSRLLVEHEIAKKVDSGYTVRMVYVTNIPADENATRYLQQAEQQGIIIDLWDLARLRPVLRQLRKEWFVAEECRLRIKPDRYFFRGTKAAPDLVLAAIGATELVAMPGISDFRLFAQNVRLGLGRTRVNREIDTAVQATGDHAAFLNFHNGLTIVARDIALVSNALTMRNYSVCNGCQSLLSFWRNRKALTEDLEVLVRVVRVGVDREIAESIAYRTNNQNAISLRDLSANDAVQLQLQSEFDSYFGDKCTYAIKRGASAPAAELPNELAGQLLLAMYNQQPWAAHQKYRVFDDLRGEIFRYGRTAAHIRFAQLAMEEIQAAIVGISNERIRKYGLTRFLLLYVVGEVLRLTEGGKTLLAAPLKYLEARGGEKAKYQQEVMKQVREIVDAVVVECDFAFEERGDSFDYKSGLKSERVVKAIRTEVLKSYKKDLKRNRVTPLTLPVVKKKAALKKKK